MDLTFEKLSEESVFYFNDTIVNCEKILKCLKIILSQERKKSVENLSIYRLESLTIAITIKKIMFERLNYNTNNKDAICESEIQLKKYLEEAISLIKEIISTGRINKRNSNRDCENVFHKLDNLVLENFPNP